mmetsp:Transcript_81124/g.225722  ORF Transcript_81124/g.225722 Transcript_81124/m.225722 type:complete len:679 (+) Transcript_81124:60-2096(+)
MLLPSLPLPTLRQTATRLLRSLDPICAQSAQPAVMRRECEEQCEELASGGGGAAALQSVLLERAEHAEHEGTSWISEWWTTYAYLASRGPLPPKEGVLLELPAALRGASQTAVAAALVRMFLEGVTKIERGTLEPDSAHGRPLCMSQYGKLFSSCRIPREGCDELVNKPGARHIAVVAAGRWFALEVLIGLERTPLGIEALTTRFDEIVSLSRQPPLAEGTRPAARVGDRVGIFTAASRELWARARKRLLELDGAAAGGRNQRCLDAIESSLFVLCLDGECAAGFSDDSTSHEDASHGGRSHDDQLRRVVAPPACHDRWYDKALQLVVFADGVAGITVEHSGFDGYPVARIVEECRAQYVRGKLGPSHDVMDTPCATELRWRTGGVEGVGEEGGGGGEEDGTLVAMLVEATAESTKACGRSALSSLRFDAFGKEAIKAWRVNPDAAVQLAMQMAFHELNGRCPATYETVATCQFRHGRTETGRVLSSESLAFVSAFSEYRRAEREHRPPLLPRVRRLFAEAAEAHQQLMGEAKSGEGIDRHLMALQVAHSLSAAEARAAGRPPPRLPRIFSHPAFAQASTWELSTSHMPSRPNNITSFHPALPDGLGVHYHLYSHQMVFTVSTDATSDATDGGRYRDGLADVLPMLRELAPLGATPGGEPRPLTTATGGEDAAVPSKL